MKNITGEPSSGERERASEAPKKTRPHHATGNQVMYEGTVLRIVIHPFHAIGMIKHACLPHVMKQTMASVMQNWSDIVFFALIPPQIECRGSRESVRSDQSAPAHDTDTSGYQLSRRGKTIRSPVESYGHISPVHRAFWSCTKDSADGPCLAAVQSFQHRRDIGQPTMVNFAMPTLRSRLQQEFTG
ncbi:hypothetical protein Bbelb_279630 [Branchiostoma belcheri]|nr:hypothetical protein Bbelb_279630 [Branchiostoma belcheri]